MSRRISVSDEVHDWLSDAAERQQQRSLGMVVAWLIATYPGAELSPEQRESWRQKVYGARRRRGRYAQS